MRTLRVFLVSSAILFSQLADAAPPWASRSYDRTTVPEQYRQSNTKTITLSSEYPREGMPLSIEVSDLIRIYGAPDVAYRPKQKDDARRCYLVYELKDGYSFAVQMPNLEGGRFYAAMLFDPTGKRVGAIIK